MQSKALYGINNHILTAVFPISRRKTLPSKRGMKIMRKKKIIITMLLVFLIGVLGLVLGGCTINNDAVTKYTVEEDHAVLTKFKGTSTMKDFVVLDEFEGKPVTKIGEFALATAEYLQTIHIGKNVKEIDIWAFSSSLELTEFTIDEANTNFAVKDGVLYTKDMKTLVAYPNKNKHTPFTVVPNEKDPEKPFTKYNFKMPDSVITIKANAFYKCNSLYFVTLSSKLEIIEERAFLKCWNIETMPFPDSLKKIMEDGCSYLGSLTDCFIPKSVEYLGDHALFGISNEKIKAIRFERANLDGIEVVGKQWRPYNSTGFGKIPLAFNETREVK